MPKKRPSPTFKDMLKQPTWSETEASRDGAYAIRPGKFNQAGDFFSPKGTKLRQVGAELTPAEAYELVKAGALLAFEGCGCGGWAGCAPVWASDEELARLRTDAIPRFVKGFGAPTWIGLWTDGIQEVAFAHGDVEWGSLPEAWPAGTK